MSAHSDPAASSDDDLQFDRAIPVSTDDSEQSRSVVVCSACAKSLPSEYFSADSAQLCATCAYALKRESAPVREWSLVLRASLFGLGAAIVGAIIYYGVIAITDFEIGIVAILIGYMVGYSVRKGARGRGGRRLQVAAIALTYFSVAMAYLPMAMKGAGGSDQGNKAAHVTVDSSSMAATPSGTDSTAAATSLDSVSVSTRGLSAGGALLGVGVLLAFALALPVMVIVGSLPSGLISALIIGIGMRQAWGMTGAPEVTIQGPFKVGRPGPAPDVAMSPPIAPA